MILDRIHCPEDLKKLDGADVEIVAGEVRDLMVGHVAENGGHLAPSLGVVDLIVAMCRAFDFPKDRVIFDVGHQSYAYKILTGRKDVFHTLRQADGISGFPKREESVYDAFDTGHASTSLSAALGLAVARDLRGDDHKIIAVIGDGALTGGMAYEAMNNAGSRAEDLIVILNDNQMSISENVGAIANYLAKVRTGPHYDLRKKAVKRVLTRTDGGEKVLSGLRRVRDSVKNLVVKGMFFEEMGFTYLGPIDGHDIPLMERYLSYCKGVKGPVLLHVLTKKGRGYPFAEAEPDKFHGIAPFHRQNGELKQQSSAATYSKIFGETLTAMAQKDRSIVAITAAMPDGTGLMPFAAAFPDRFFDVGIAESHAVTYGAGLAESGMKPWVAIYSSFLQRGVDQIFHDVCLQDLPVVFAVDRAGVVGEDGETHQGLYDIALLRPFPNMTLMAPSSIKELRAMMAHAASLGHPAAIRYPRGAAAAWDQDRERAPLQQGKGELLREGGNVLLIPVGAMVETGLRAAEILAAEGIDVSVFDPRFIKPLDRDGLLALAATHHTFVTVEDHVLAGGFGSAVREVMAESDVAIVSLGFPDVCVRQGKRSDIMVKYGLDHEAIAAKVRERVAK